MPEYRKLREKQSLWHLFHTPELAAQVTLLPIDILNVDAAILFSDILVVAEALGGTVHFPEGKSPHIEMGPQFLFQPEVLHYVPETIRLLKPQLKVPLIGFCGGPFTVASYILEEIKKSIYKDAQSLHELLEKITTATIAYLHMQIEAGVDAIQIFDSWANLLTHEEFHQFSYPYLKKILASLNIPTILFCRGSCILAEDLATLNPTCISFDSHKPLAHMRKTIQPPIAVQGNLDPYLLYAPKQVIIQKTQELLRSMQSDPGFIVNLGHGIFPDIPVDHVKCFVDQVLEFSPSVCL